MSEVAPARPRLDRRRIVEGLLEIGVDQFSMHSLARHLGVSATALYRYFGSREELMAAAMDAFCEGLEVPDAGAEWTEYLRLLGRAFRRRLLEMPGAADYGAAIGPATPSAFGIVEAALGVLRRAGFTGIGAWRAYSLVVNHAFHSVQGQEHFESLVARNGPGGFRVFQLSDQERERFPELSRVVDAQHFDFELAFEEGLACIVAGILAEHERGAM